HADVLVALVAQVAHDVRHLLAEPQVEPVGPGGGCGEATCGEGQAGKRTEHGRPPGQGSRLESARKRMPDRRFAPRPGLGRDVGALPSPPATSPLRSVPRRSRFSRRAPCAAERGRPGQPCRGARAGWLWGRGTETTRQAEHYREGFACRSPVYRPGRYSD